MAMRLQRPSRSAARDFPARRLARLEAPLHLHRGGVVEQPVVAYECWGRLNASRDNTVLLFTGLSPPANAASSTDDPTPGWWESMIGEGKPIDTRRFFVVCVNSLASPFGSSGPASVDPRSGAERRHHLDEKLLQRAMKKAVQAAGIAKPATPHTLRHSFATHEAERFGSLRGRADIGQDITMGKRANVRQKCAIFHNSPYAGTRPGDVNVRSVENAVCRAER